MVRIQILIDEEEREVFRRIADKQGLSLSAWLRQAAKEKADSAATQTKITSLAELDRFFRECDRREKGKGREPDWDDHLAVIEQSRSQGRC